MFKHLLLFFYFGIIHFSQSGFASADHIEEQYINQLNYQFNQQNFDSCIRISYILASSYSESKNYNKLSNVWYTISFLYLLLDHTKTAQISINTADYYAELGQIDYKDFQTIFKAITNYKAGNYKQASIQFTKIKSVPISLINRLPKLISLFQSDAAVNLIPTDENHSLKLVNYLQNLKQSRDTNWFAYPLSYYLIGYKYFLSKSYNRSIIYLNPAITSFERLNIFSTEWIKSYVKIIGYLNSSKNENLKKEYFQRISSQLITHKNQLKCSSHDFYELKTDLYYNNSNFQEAVNRYLIMYSDPNWAKIKNEIRSNIIQSYFILYQFKELLDFYKKTDHESVSNYDKTLVAYAYYIFGFHTESLALLSEVEKKITEKDDAYFNAIRMLAYTYSRLRVLNKAESYYKVLLKYNNQEKTSFHISYAYINYGYFCWVYKSDFVKALELYHKAEYSLLACAYNPDYYAIPDLSTSVDNENLEMVINNKAETFYQLSKKRKTKSEELRDLKASLNHFELSLALIHQTKMNLPREEQQLVYADLTKSQYPNTIKVCLELYKKTGDILYANKAFEYAEKSKSSLLLSTIEGANSPQLKLIPQSLKNKEEEIRTRASICVRERKNEYKQANPNLKQIDLLNTALLQLKQSQDSLVNVFKNHYKSYYNSRYNADIVSPQQIQKKLTENEALIQYSVRQDFLSTYVITKREFKIFTDTIGPEFFADVENYRSRISKFSYNDTHDTSIISFACVSNRLYKHLIRPAESTIGSKKLIIVPDDALTQIPFEALVTNESQSTKKASYKDFNYLIRQHSISYSFSGTLYYLNHSTETFNHTNLLAVAPSYENINPEKKKINGPGNLSTIKGTYDEVEILKNIFHGDMLVREKATELQFKKIANRYDILHLAMHGAIDNESPMFSKLIFTPTKDTVNEGFLNTYEIYNMKLHAPLVVLSACNTGSGKLHSGEGIISLARGFFTAGVKCVVMTLWSVADKSSSQLMQLFYLHLSANDNVSTALQKAKLEYLDRSDMISSHPYFWAGYIATGNSEVSFEIKKNHTTLVVSVIILFVLGLFLFWKWKFRNG